MTRLQLAPPEGILVAIDVAKARNEVPGSLRRRRLSVLNTRGEHDRLIALLSDLGQPVTCGFEATGNYHRPIAWRLLQAGFAVRRISSVALARPREALHNGWDKNDPKDAQVLSKETFIAAAWDVVGRKIAKKQVLGDIYETARSWIGLPVPPGAPAVRMFRLVIGEVRGLLRLGDAIEVAADTLRSESADYKLMRRIPDIGPINALTILAEAGDMRRFSHHRQFLKLCGLDLATQQSGTFRGQTKLSKCGNARLRRTLQLAGQVAIRQRENSFRDKFEHYIARDRHNADLRRKALTEITAKMTRVVYAVIKTGDDYRPFVEGAVPSGRTPLNGTVRA